MIRIDVVRGDGKKESYKFSKSLIKIGRHSSNDIYIDDELASRFHAEIELLNDKHFIRDLVSKNGVFVNETQIFEQPVNPKDCIRIGNTTLVFDIELDEFDNYVTQEVQLVEPENDKRVGAPLKEKKIDIHRGINIDTKPESAGEKPTKDLSHFIKTYFELSKILLRSGSIPNMLMEASNLIETNIKFKKLIIMLYDSKGKNLEPVVVRSAGKAQKTSCAIEISKTIVDSCLKEKNAVFCEDARHDSRFTSSESIHDFQIQSVACIPLIGTEKNLGILYLEDEMKASEFSEEETQFLISIANDICLAIENYRLREARFQTEKNAFVQKFFASFNEYVNEIIAIYKEDADNLKCAVDFGEIAKIRKLTEKIDIYVNKLSEFFNDIEIYLKGQKLQPKKITLGNLIGDIFASLIDVFEKRHISYNLNVDQNSLEISVDVEAIQKSLLNIIFFMIENLKSATNAHIEISTEVFEDNYVSIIIQDNSAGLPKENLSQIFDPFLSTKEIKNTGLGLAIAQRLIRACGGMIECESENNFGTSFIVSLPFDA